MYSHLTDSRGGGRGPEAAGAQSSGLLEEEGFEAPGCGLGPIEAKEVQSLRLQVCPGSRLICSERMPHVRNVSILSS